MGDALGGPGRSVTRGLGISASTWDRGEGAQPQWERAAHSALLKADPQLPEDLPAPMTVYPPADEPRTLQSCPNGQGGPAEIPLAVPAPAELFPGSSIPQPRDSQWHLISRKPDADTCQLL